MRMPDVEDQHDAELVAVVPGLVLDGIVEHPRLARNPLPDIVADAESTSLRDDQREMRDQAGVGYAVVRRNAGFRLEQRKHRGRRASGLIRLRRTFQGSD